MLLSRSAALQFSLILILFIHSILYYSVEINVANEQWLYWIKDGYFSVRLYLY